MDIKGKLLEKGDTQKVSDKFQKREFVVEYAENPQYPEFIKFELVQDRCSQLDPFQLGQEIEVHFNLRGRKWVDPKGETKYFNSLNAWRIVAASAQDASASSSPSADSGSNSAVPTAANQMFSEQDEDLPF
jgi:hypothetical protein